MSGYNVRVTRDNVGVITARDIAEYTTGFVTPPEKGKQSFQYIPSEQFQNPIIVLVPQPPGEDLITIENDADEDVNDGLWNTMEASIRSFAQARMGVDDDSNLVAADRDIVKLLNGMIFMVRAFDASEYNSDGLLAHVTTSSFTVGDPLNTTMKVANYYKEVLRELHDSVISERDTFLDNRL